MEQTQTFTLFKCPQCGKVEFYEPPQYRIRARRSTTSSDYIFLENRKNTLLSVLPATSIPLPTSTAV